jgi:hypothetical protein
MLNHDKLAAENVGELVRSHLQRYPAVEIMDMYKLLHQATFGPGHLIASKKTALEWLEHELNQQRPSLDEPFIENIHPEGLIMRVHLRPYLAHQGPIKLLLDAFVRSAGQVEGDAKVMADRWQIFETLCQGAFARNFPIREVGLFGLVRARERWPAVHHSPAYNDTYHPAYRVLTRSEAQLVCEKLKVPFEVT